MNVHGNRHMETDTTISHVDIVGVLQRVESQEFVVDVIPTSNFVVVHYSAFSAANYSYALRLKYLAKVNYTELHQKF